MMALGSSWPTRRVVHLASEILECRRLVVPTFSGKLGRKSLRGMLVYQAIRLAGGLKSGDLEHGQGLRKLASWKPYGTRRLQARVRGAPFGMLTLGNVSAAQLTFPGHPNRRHAARRVFQPPR